MDGTWRSDGPTSLGDILGRVEIGRKGSGDLLRRVNWREALRAELGEALWSRTAVIEVSAQRVVLGALGPALYALRRKRMEIERTLRDAGFTGEVALVVAGKYPSKQQEAQQD